MSDFRSCTYASAHLQDLKSYNMYCVHRNNNFCKILCKLQTCNSSLLTTLFLSEFRKKVITLILNKLPTIFQIPSNFISVIWWIKDEFLTWVDTIVINNLSLCGFSSNTSYWRQTTAFNLTLVTDDQNLILGHIVAEPSSCDRQASTSQYRTDSRLYIVQIELVRHLVGDCVFGVSLLDDIYFNSVCPRCKRWWQTCNLRVCVIYDVTIVIADCYHGSVAIWFETWSVDDNLLPPKRIKSLWVEVVHCGSEGWRILETVS